jgi:hypothetical protein
MKIQKFGLYLWLCCITLILSILILPHNSASALRTVEHTLNDPAISTTIDILIYNIDPAKKSAAIQANLVLTNFPYNATQIIITLIGRERFQIVCTNSSGMYIGNSGIITWYLRGYGEDFPFDNYFLDVTFDEESVIWKVENSSEFLKPSATFAFNNDSVAVFIGSEAESLMGIWRTQHENRIPMVFSENRATVIISRNSLIPYYMLLLPIVLCFYVLGTSIFLERNKIEQRLTVYFSLFLFASPFLFAIQTFLPYRSTLSIPELLLVTLMVGNCIFIFMSIIPTESDLQGMIFDAVAVFVSCISFLVLYFGVIFDKINLVASLTIFFAELAAYMVPAVYLLARLCTLVRERKAMQKASSQYIY